MSPTSSSTGTSSCRCRTSRRSTARAAATRRRTIGHRAACATTSATRSSGMSGALLSLRNVAKAWLLLLGACLLFAGLGYLAGGLRLLSALVFCCLLLAAATYWYAFSKNLDLVEVAAQADPPVARVRGAARARRDARSRAAAPRPRRRRGR